MRLNTLVGGITLALVILTPLATAAERGEANVEAVDVHATGGNTFRFRVTIASNDTGWDYYADAFEVVAPDGEVLGTRTLHHPHENEQPFTRGLRSVEIPGAIERVTVRAHHSKAGYDGRTQTVELPR